MNTNRTIDNSANLQAAMKAIRARNCPEASVLAMRIILLALLALFIFAHASNRVPSNISPVSMRDNSTIRGPSAAELVPIYSGNAGSSMSFGGGFSLGGGAR